MNRIESGVRFELVQLTGVLVLDNPKPGEALVYDAASYPVIDFRQVFGEWQSLTRTGDALSLKFGDGGSIKLDHFFNTDVPAPKEVLVQIGDTLFISPDTLFQSFASVEERAVSDSGPISGGAWFLPTPLTLPLGDDDPSPLLGDENPLVPDDPIPEVTANEDLFEIDPPAPQPDPPADDNDPPDPPTNVAIVNAVFGNMSQLPLD